MKNKKAFTLIELIIVIAIIAILAGAIFVAIDPARRLHEARNARRASDIANILDAVKKYQADHSGTHYYLIESMTKDVNYLIGESAGSCIIDCSVALQSACVDLSEMGTDYLAIIPKDPKDGTDLKTGYAIRKDDTGAITVIACGAEGEGQGGAGDPPDLLISR